MRLKILIGGVLIVLGIVLGTINFVSSNVEYGDFQKARQSKKKIQVKGEWVKERESFFDSKKKKFEFYLKDDSGEILKVVLAGIKPNNFESASSVVVKGKITGDYFYATDVLTKCPSKYEGKKGPMK